MEADPPPFVWGRPDEKNILNWHYIVRGPPDTPYAGGEYHGMIMFPPEYPFKPPGIKMLTPSGRFVPDKKICFSMSDYHPGTWNPAWSVATILTGLLSFMLTEEMTTGSESATWDNRVQRAKLSHAWNTKQKRFRDAFPEYSLPEMKDLPNMGIKERGQPETSASEEKPSQVSIPAPLRNSSIPIPTSGPKADRHATARPTGWISTMSQVVWKKWRWGVFMVVAVLIARFSS